MNNEALGRILFWLLGTMKVTGLSVTITLDWPRTIESPPPETEVTIGSVRYVDCDGYAPRAIFELVDYEFRGYRIVEVWGVIPRGYPFNIFSSACVVFQASDENTIPKWVESDQRLSNGRWAVAASIGHIQDPEPIQSKMSFSGRLRTWFRQFAS